MEQSKMCNLASPFCCLNGEQLKNSGLSALHLHDILGSYG